MVLRIHFMLQNVCSLHPYEVGIITPILQIRKQRHKGSNQLLQVPASGEFKARQRGPRTCALGRHILCSCLHHVPALVGDHSSWMKAIAPHRRSSIQPQTGRWHRPTIDIFRFKRSIKSQRKS